MCWSAWELHREHGAIEHPHTRRLGGSCHTRPAGQPSPGHLACAKTLKSPVCPFLPDGTMSEQNQAPIQPQDENQLIAERREKLKALRAGQAQGRGVAFPNDFKPRNHAASLQQQYGALPIWAAVEVWDFGLLSKLFAGMQHADQEQIATLYGAPSGQAFAQWLRSLNFIH